MQVVFTTTTDQKTVVLKGGSMHEGTFYKFEISYTNETIGYVTWVYVEFTTNAAPKDGSFQVVPSEGFYLTTLFQFIANGWTDEDMPIYYQVF